MMTPNELRALADALDSPASGMTTAAAAAYLRAYAATPAAPQAEPIDPHMIVAEDRFPDEQAEPKREPLTVSRILDIEADAIRQWRDNGRIIEFTVVFARMIERTHGIGGDDAE